MMYSINYKTGKLEPIETSDKDNLPVGTVLQLNGYDDPRYVITENKGIDTRWGGGARYQTINLKTLIPAVKSTHEFKWLKDKTCNMIQTYITDEVLPLEEVEEIKEKSKLAVVEAARRLQEAAEKKARELAELPARYPNLIPGTNEKAGAVNIRIELKKAFPTVKFAVTIEHRGSSSINIGWTDGPTTDQVKEITGKYQEGNFNGMEDIYEYSNNLFCDVFGGARYVFRNRHNSEM